ncbi:hypothetical protein [Aestuariispira ectoiniformans]|uniref:hypothetical protein n=1 Tax=Aestuariispira ectoiniformans TaxID=2775080 RepID=UPI00223BCB28|nr:hypothetical protein [Aestuariispira ectoiniformans]
MPYYDDVQSVLPRVLSLFDTNIISTTYGIGDRYRWAWKGTDFANGTFQGAAHGMAALLAGGLLPSWFPETAVLNRIEGIFEGTSKLIRKNGSLDEILPNESSYCVTALVAFDLLRVISLVRTAIKEEQVQRYLGIVSPLISHLSSNRESHGIISNHLSVAAAALARWHSETGEDQTDHIDAVLAVILKHRSPEGWFREYEGADPGYQSLTMDYLVDLDRVAPELGLQPKLAEALDFLSWCCHPDGSYGGLYGSRNTRFLYPAGIEELAGTIPMAASMAKFMRRSHAERSVVGLAAMDDSNLIPMFNSFCRAAVAATKKTEPEGQSLPFEREGSETKRFDDAGLLFHRSSGAYTVINWKKGGVVQRYSEKSCQVNAGFCARDRKGDWYTGQLVSDHIETEWLNSETLCVKGPLLKYHVALPSSFQMIVLRLLGLTALRFKCTRNAIKKILVYLLITRKRVSGAIFKRTIKLGPDFSIEDTWDVPVAGLERVEHVNSFQAIHMASQGYWQCSDDR